ncbi:F-box/kelch-repeat protein At3g06240-like [Cornus florida]|uniref:F-box/kelch-repeat protein At3g06240-like n=1 Tax=Cornus florida TaxID=4283 RepID=UPI002896BF63|nr:F-box/kelch-repeat protein At3g06240-like [Cornus florida]
MASCNEIHQLLPEDVIIEILLRLPVKSVIRARVVCKNWYTITKNPSFVTKHFNHPANSGRLFVNRFDKISKNMFSHCSLIKHWPVLRRSIRMWWWICPTILIWVSACNGILCISYHLQRFALWNPATREFRSLPALPRNFPPNVASFRETFGFGFNPITNDYKVVWIWNTKEDVGGLHQISYGPYQAAVYTLSTDSWRYLEVALHYASIRNPQSNTCINGVYYWFAIDNDDSRLILSFDMGNELFHEIRDIPSSNDGYINSIALIYSHSGDIWVTMEERDGDRHVALYDPETREIKHIGSPIWADCFVYRESLVAIKGGDGFLEQDQSSDVDQIILNFSKMEFRSS